MCHFKMKVKELNIGISKAISICLKAGVKVYPVNINRHFKIEVNDNGNLIRYDKIITQQQVNSAQSKTYKHWANVILKKQENGKDA